MLHIIKKQTIELIMNRQQDSFQMQQLISEHYRDDIIPILEKLLDKISGADEYLYIDKLEIDLGIITKKEITSRKWADEFSLELTKQLQEKVSLASSGSGQNAKLQSVSSGVYHQWLFYMQNGYLPWNSLHVDRNWNSRILEALEKSNENREFLRNLLLTNPKVIQRIVQQHPEEFLLRLIEIITTQMHKKLHLILKELEVLIIHYINIDAGISTFTRQALKKKLWEKTLDFSVKHGTKAGTVMIAENILQIYTGQPAILQSALHAISVGLHELPAIIKNWERKNKSVPDKEISLPTEEIETLVPEDDKHKDKDGVFVQNAGLVLLHPFLNTLFSRLLLVKNSKFINPAAYQKALYLLHYLATGKSDAEEYELVIPKKLCAYPLKKPVEKDVHISEKEKKEADHLLEEAIVQWEVLKNTSLSGLREGFLQRKGKLVTKNEQEYLQVETNSIDALLDRLPWNLSIIKLPWMQQVIRVEWR